MSSVRFANEVDTGYWRDSILSTGGGLSGKSFAFLTKSSTRNVADMITSLSGLSRFRRSETTRDNIPSKMSVCTDLESEVKL